MTRKWPLLTLIFSLCSGGALQANPLDSPDIVYIDGLPCNRACRAYMAWSDRALSARHREQRETNAAVPAEAEIEGAEHAARPRVTRKPVPTPRPTQRASMAASHSKASNTRKAAGPNRAHRATRKDMRATTATMTQEKAGEKAVAAAQAPERKLKSAGRPEPGQEASVAVAQPTEAPNSEMKSEIKPEIALPPPATLEIAAPPATAAPAPEARTIRQQVVEATGLADLATAIGVGRESGNRSDSPATESGEVGDTDKKAPASSDNPDNLVALILTRPEINSLSSLNNKSIAIEEMQSASSGRVSAGLMAAGAAEVQVSEGQTAAIDRLISDEVPAAVLTLASPEAAERFPDIDGFRVYRVPLSVKARL